MQDGWGLATDGNVLFGSDGTSTLYQLDSLTGKGLLVYSSYLIFNVLPLVLISFLILQPYTKLLSGTMIMKFLY